MLSSNPGENVSFDPAEYTPERTLARITEIRNHLSGELLPRTERCSVFVADFVRYLDAWAFHFQSQLSAPIEFLALVTRNLLEFALLPEAFENPESRALFSNEALRIDVDDLRARASQVFAAVDASPPLPSLEGLGWLPHSRVGPVGKRDVFDAWVHKYCSKLMHPTAIMILVPEALTNPEKRMTLRFRARHQEIARFEMKGKTMVYPAKFTPDRTAGGFVVTFPDVPEAITQGDAIEEAMAVASEALELALTFYTGKWADLRVAGNLKRGMRMVRVPA